MYKYKLGFIFLMVLGTISCSRYPKDVEIALRLAGNNRGELEKTLEYYSTYPGDSLKLRAAQFLIANMPGLYTRISLRTDLYVQACRQYIRRKKDPYTVVDSLNMHCRRDKDEVINDVHAVTSDFLIANIEYSFKVWQEQPWGKLVSFDDFCELILPYRVKDERLALDWKKMFYDRFQPVIDSLCREGCRDVITVCKVLNKQLMSEDWYTTAIDDVGLPALSPDEAISLRTGTCPQRVELGMYVMRALGIPVATDFIEQWPYRSSRHYWNAVMDSLRHMHVFVATDSNPEDQNHGKMGKVYRVTTKMQPDQVIPRKEQTEAVPPVFRRNRVVDVTTEYIPDAIDVNIDLVREYINGHRLAYLCVFNNQQWVPITWGRIQGTHVFFSSVEKEIACAVAIYEDQEYSFASYPFIIGEDDQIRYIKPDTSELISVMLTRKYGYIGFGSKSHTEMQGGLFQAGNDTLPVCPITLYRIEDGSKVCVYNKIGVNPSKPYRYAWYYSAPGSCCNIAELVFYNPQGEELKGKRIGTTCVLHPLYSPDKAFDGDILTFYHSCQLNDAWIGLDFGKPEWISSIYFVPRNDDNYIKPGDLYELQYLSVDGWHSIGEKIVSERSLKYNEDPSVVITYDRVPSKALYRLRNLTRGKEERIFEIDEKGNQVWW